jgi:hypothetical protein
MHQLHTCVVIGLTPSIRLALLMLLLQAVEDLVVHSNIFAPYNNPRRS